MFKFTCCGLNKRCIGGLIGESDLHEKLDISEITLGKMITITYNKM